MKTLQVIIFLLSVNFTLISQNLFTNGDFELGTGHNFTDWVKIENDGGVITEEALTVHSGSRAAKAIAGGTNFWALQLRGQNRVTTLGDLYVASFWVNGKSGDLVVITAETNAGNQDTYITLSGGWEEITYTFNANDTATTVILHLGEVTEATYVDDAKLLAAADVENIRKTHSDNGDGTFTNPVIFADYPDPDVIRVGDVYYMVSTTMFVFPGAPILKSYDLVNWEYCSNAITQIDENDCYFLEACNRYGKGQWASSLKYNNGTFYMLFTTLNEGGFISVSDSPEGPWTLKKLPRGFYDPGLFFDTDGRIYVAHGINDIKITELNADFEAIGSDNLVFTNTYRDGLEGTHMYKINNYYYLYCTYGGYPAFQVALRSENIYGPYEEKKLLQDDNIHQGSLIETQTGAWWTLLFYDKGPFGRFPNLQPITWVDDWPMIGLEPFCNGSTADESGPCGKGVKTYNKPNVGQTYPIKELPTSDLFDTENLGLQWGWNHVADLSKWSLTDKPGYLRLSTAKVVSNLTEAPNTLTQRVFGYYSNTIASTGTVKIELSNMNSGDVAGLSIFQDPYAYIGVKQEGREKRIVMVNNGETIASTVLNASIIYLRALPVYGTGKATFEYSLDGINYTQLGNQLTMQFNLTIFTGIKFGLFNYATISTGGYVDFDWFSTLIDHADLLETEDAKLKSNVIRLYPNPVDNTLFIDNEKHITIKKIILLSMDGKVIAEKQSQFSSLDLSTLQKGVYVARIITEQKKYSYKIIKK